MTTEQTKMEQELAEVKRLKRCQTLRECPDPRWKLIQHLTMEREGELFERKLWVAVCGGAVEYIEGLTPEGKRVYQVERFELKPESWAKEQVIALPCSVIYPDRFDNKEDALQKVEEWKETIKPLWFKVKKEVEKPELK